MKHDDAIFVNLEKEEVSLGDTTLAKLGRITRQEAKQTRALAELVIEALINVNARS